MAASPILAVVILFTAEFVAGDSWWWLLGLSGFMRSPGATSPGMVVVT
jgi:hypothetical protein